MENNLIMEQPTEQGLVTANVNEQIINEIPSSITGMELGLLEWSEAKRQSEPNTTDPSQYPTFFTEDDEIRGVPGQDYFRVRYVYADDTYANQMS